MTFFGGRNLSTPVFAIRQRKDQIGNSAQLMDLDNLSERKPILNFGRQWLIIDRLDEYKKLSYNRFRFTTHFFAIQ
jgi:hypothetical protein